MLCNRFMTSHDNISIIDTGKSIMSVDELVHICIYTCIYIYICIYISVTQALLVKQ